MNEKIFDKLKVDQAIAPQDVTTDRTSSYFPVADYGWVAAIVTTDAVAQTKVVTIQLLKAINANGDSPAAWSSVVTETAPTGGSTLTAKVEKDVDDIGDGYTHVAVKVTSDDTGNAVGAAVLLRGSPRYAPPLADPS